VYGRRQLGGIQGSAQLVTVLASALGPLLLAWCVERTDSYRAMFALLAGVIAVLGLAAFVVVIPAPAGAESRSPARPPVRGDPAP
jgi:MFS family permease